MSLATVVELGLIAMMAILLAMLFRQRGVYRTYRNAQQQVLDRQAEVLAVQREALDTQKEMARLLTVIASRERS
jgi:hypothetical protein